MVLLHNNFSSRTKEGEKKELSLPKKILEILKPQTFFSERLKQIEKFIFAANYEGVFVLKIIIFIYVYTGKL